MIINESRSANLRLLTGAILLSVCTSAYSNDSGCISRAEAESGVPAGLLTHMKTAESGVKVLPEDDLYGPMALSGKTITLAAEGMHVSPDEIKKDRYHNCRAAAWLLMNACGGNSGNDIFSAVNSYYYGLQSRATGKLTLTVKSLYQLTSG